MKRPFNQIHREEAQGALEFAIVIPLVLLLLLGILEFGWLLNAKITLTGAAREGARVAVVSTIDQRNRAFMAAQDAVTGVSGITLINDNDHFVYYTDEELVENTNNVIIEIKGLVRPIVGLFVNNPVTIRARAAMRIE